MAATSALGEVMTAALNDDRAFKHIKADALQAWEATCHFGLYQLSDATSFPLRMKLLAALHKLFLARPSTLSANLTLASDQVLEDNASHRKARLKIKQFQVDHRLSSHRKHDSGTHIIFAPTKHVSGRSLPERRS